MSIRLFLLVYILPFLLLAAGERTKISVIINPISGGINKDNIVKLIEKKLSGSRYDVEILYTEAPKHATRLAKEASDRHRDIVLVVGGDGSINETAQSLIGTDTALAIIPTGSGNGLARHLHIPADVAQSLEIVLKNHIRAIDTIRVNDSFYLGVAGVGFDAKVALAFANFGHRGFLSYLIVTLKEFFSYKPVNYELTVDGTHISKKAFLISFANSSQFGNGASIAPQAQIDDGYLDMVVVKKVPFYASAYFAYQLFHGSINSSGYVETLQCKTVDIEQENLSAHIDGEPVFFKDGMHIKIEPASLKVVVP